MTGSAPGAIAVNLLWCVPGDVGGSEQYLVRQLVGLAEAAPDLARSVTLHGSAELAAAHPRLAAQYAFVASPTDNHRRWRRTISESGWLHRRTRDSALVHHGGGTAPWRARRPYVLTIHDLQYRTHPHYFSRGKRAYLDATMPRSARGAARVLVPSEYVRGSVIRELHAEPDRVIVVPHGFEPQLLEDVTPEDELRTRHGLGDGPVVVYPAMTAPHKNHRFLFDLLAGPWRGRDERLVLVGGRGLAETEIAARLADDAALRQRVVRLGRVSDADRNGLIRMASALVFPSEYEGFGAPVIEAMALGTPVVTSDATCLPDVVGAAGLVRPLDASSWASALDEVGARRDELVAAGRLRVQAFTARASGCALARVYEDVLAA